MSSRFKKRLEQLHGSRQRRRARKSESGESRVFTAEGVETESAPTRGEADSLANKWITQGAKTRPTPRGDATFLVRAHPRGHQHGTRQLADGAATELDCFRKQLNDERLHSADPRRLAFLDLETNGLSKSSFPFCIGIGLWEGASFSVYHYFTPSDEHEPAALSACAQILGDVDGLCTFNGSSFDVRMLERRFRQHDIEHGLTGLPHLDLLHLARKLWPDRKSHKLSRLEEDKLGFERTGDIPGAKIPGRWREYLEADDPRLLLDIFDHNRLDILSMVVLIAELADTVSPSSPASTSSAGSLDGASSDAASASSSGTHDKPRTKLTSRLARSYSLRDKAQRAKDGRKKAAADKEPEPPKSQPEKQERQNVTLDASFSRSQLRKGMPIGARLRELRADIERSKRSGESDRVLSMLHEMVALAPRNPFALQALVDHYRQTGQPALAEHFEKRLGETSPF